MGHAGGCAPKIGPKSEASRCPLLRYAAPYFYMFGGGEGVVTRRSKDLVRWDSGDSAMVCGGDRAPADRRVVYAKSY